MAEWPAGYANCAIPARIGVGTYGLVTFGVDCDGQTDPTFLAEVIWGCFMSSVLPLLDDTSTWGPVEVSIGPSSAPLSGSGTSSSPGGATIASPPPNTAVLVQKRSLTGGRRGRGRYYWPFAADEGSVDENGNWNPAAVANFQIAQTDFLEELETASVPMVLLHADGGAPSLVTALSVQQLTATQRRRLRR